MDEARRRQVAQEVERRMHSSLTILVLVLCLPAGLGSIPAGQATPHPVPAQDGFPAAAWTQIPSLDQAGWSKTGLLSARRYADADAIHTSALMVVQGGAVVDQWGDIDRKIDAYSIRKSLLSALYGIYAAEGLIDINQTLEQLGIDDAPDPLTRAEKQARVVDLLRA